ncbi:ATP-binding protein [Microbacterium sp.]|uniref:ATP-binding protein n=1 Tax=Microbacterium sp. TaxID=51671 RepID=UPI003735AECA
MSLTLERQQPLSTYEGWQTFVDARPLPEPEPLTKRQIRSLDDRARDEYDSARRAFHRDTLVRTDQLRDANDQLLDLLESNMQGVDRVKGAGVIDAPPGLGKSTTLNQFGREFHRRQVARYGETMEDGALHIPVCRVWFAGRMTTKSLNGMIFDYYAHPAGRFRRRSATEHNLAATAAEAAVRHGTRLFIVDDIHFLKPRTNDGGQVANQLKWLANEYPVTFVFAGVDLNNSGILEEGRLLETAQTARRWTRIPMSPFTVLTEEGDAEWKKLVKTVESRLVLGRVDQEVQAQGRRVSMV